MLIGKPILDPLTSEALSLEPAFAQTQALWYLADVHFVN